MTGAFNAYTRHYKTYINERSHELVYSSKDSPKTYTNITECLHHLIEEPVHQGEGGEPLLDISSITEDEYIETVKTLNITFKESPVVLDKLEGEEQYEYTLMENTEKYIKKHKEKLYSQSQPRIINQMLGNEENQETLQIEIKTVILR